MFKLFAVREVVRIVMTVLVLSALLQVKVVHAGHGFSCMRGEEAVTRIEKPVIVKDDLRPDEMSKVLEVLHDVIPSLPTDLIKEIVSYFHRNKHPEIAEITKLYEEAVLGDPYAMIELYRRYRGQARFSEEKGIDRFHFDRNEVIYWLTLAQQYKWPTTQHCALAFEKLLGVTTEKDDAGAIQLLKQAITQGGRYNQNYAKSLLGWCYLEGRGVEKNLASAKNLLEQAEKANDQQAMWILANHDNKGTFGPVDPVRARKRMEKAVRANYTWALRDLALMKERGLGRKERHYLHDTQEALADYKKAAELRDERAEIDLAIYYVKGIVGLADEKQAKAHFWEGLKRAREQPNNVAVLNDFSLDEVLKYLTLINRKEDYDKDERVRSLVEEFVNEHGEQERGEKVSGVKRHLQEEEKKLPEGKEQNKV